MSTQSPPPAALERAGRLNEALLRHGALAVTTAATGGIDLDMLIDVLRPLGMTMRTCAIEPMGRCHVVFSQRGAKRGDRPAESDAIAGCRSAAIVEAALAALRLHAP